MSFNFLQIFNNKAETCFYFNKNCRYYEQEFKKKIVTDVSGWIDNKSLALPLTFNRNSQAFKIFEDGLVELSKIDMKMVVDFLEIYLTVLQMVQNGLEDGFKTVFNIKVNDFKLSWRWW